MIEYPKINQSGRVAARPHHSESAPLSLSPSLSVRCTEPRRGRGRGIIEVAESEINSSRKFQPPPPCPLLLCVLLLPVSATAPRSSLTDLPVRLCDCFAARLLPAAAAAGAVGAAVAVASVAAASCFVVSSHFVSPLARPDVALASANGCRRSRHRRRRRRRDNSQPADRHWRVPPPEPERGPRLGLVARLSSAACRWRRRWLDDRTRPADGSQRGWGPSRVAKYCAPLAGANSTHSPNSPKPTDRPTN